MLKFFSYLGSKKTLAPEYGAPRRDVVVEPFAGSAGYSLHWEPKKVILIDKSPIIADIWRWLLSTCEEEVMSLPEMFDSTDDLDIPQGAKNLIGFWLKHVSDKPAVRVTGKMFDDMRNRERWAWSVKVKRRLAAQLPLIKNWEFIEGDYSDAPDGDFHYFVDPPYQHLKGFYNSKMNFAELAEWCKTKQCIDVCERDDADWLPFERFRTKTVNEGKRYRTNNHYDVVWRRGFELEQPTLF